MNNKTLSIFSIVAFVLFLISLIGVSALFVYNKNENSNLSNSEITESVDYSSFRYVALGDSITFGCSNAHPTQYDNGGYPQLVKEILNLKFAQNCGVPGNQIDAMLSRLDEMYANAEIISVMGGVNDCNSNVILGSIEDTKISTFYGRVKLLANALLKKYPNSFIFFMTPFQSGRNNIMNGNAIGYKLEDYANAIKEVCKLYDIPVLDMYNLGQFELEMNNPNSDGVHPSEQFFENYTAPQIAQFIKDNYKK